MPLSRRSKSRGANTKPADLQIKGRVRTAETQRANDALQAEICKGQQVQGELRMFLAMIPTMVWRGLPDGSVEFHNQRWLDYTGMTAEQAKGWGWTASIHPGDLPGLVGKLRAFVATKEAGDVEGRLRRFDGQYRWFLFRTAPLRDERGVVIKWFGATTDIEDRKR